MLDFINNNIGEIEKIENSKEMTAIGIMSIESLKIELEKFSKETQYNKNAEARFKLMVNDIQNLPINFEKKFQILLDNISNFQKANFSNQQTLNLAPAVGPVEYDANDPENHPDTQGRWSVDHLSQYRGFEGE